ncbi:MAG: hypothetical protein AB2797_04620, partial [Candidatus Thiodiazotropha sp.]
DLYNKLIKTLGHYSYEKHIKQLDYRELENRLQGFKDRFKEVTDIQYHSYKKTSNPLYIWETYSQCRNVEMPIPDWIYEYFDQCSSNLMKHWDNPPGEPAKAIAKSLSMASPGRGSVFTETSKRDQTIAMVMGLYLLLDPKLKPDQLYDSMAKDFGVSRSTVQRAWTEWSRENKK